MTRDAPTLTVSSMDRATAVFELPLPYAVAVRLRDSGSDDRTIATALAIDVDEVTTLLRMADAKLAALTCERP
jgi:hypothetical protein